MKTFSCCFHAAFCLVLAASASAASYEWGFTAGNLNADLGPGVMSYAGTTAGLTTFGTTDGSTIPHIGGAAATYMSFPQWPTPAANDPTLGYLLDFTASGPNGGGSYLNRYTIIFDAYFPGTLDWTPLFNTDPANSLNNDADWYLAGDGSVGIGALGYSATSLIHPNTWYRLGFTVDLGAGDARYYINGTEVFHRTSTSILLDGKFSLYSNLDAGADLLIANENDTSGNYTRPQIYSSIAFLDRTLTATEFAGLGGPNAAGILVPEPGSLSLLGIGTLALVALRRRSQS
jgi:hypothetical protein